MSRCTRYCISMIDPRCMIDLITLLLENRTQKDWKWGLLLELRDEWRLTVHQETSTHFNFHYNFHLTGTKFLACKYFETRRGLKDVLSTEWFETSASPEVQVSLWSVSNFIIYCELRPSILCPRTELSWYLLNYHLFPALVLHISCIPLRARTQWPTAFTLMISYF